MALLECLGARGQSSSYRSAGKGAVEFTTASEPSPSCLQLDADGPLPLARGLGDVRVEPSRWAQPLGWAKSLA